MITVLITVLYCLLYPFACYLFGTACSSAVVNRRCSQSTGGLCVAERVTLGLLLHLVLLLILASIGIPLLLASLLAWLPAFCVIPMWRQLLVEWQGFRQSTFALRAHEWLFLLFMIVVGVTLFDAGGERGITTPWRNNFGDLAFHLGMISSFVFGENLPPEYHIYPGVKLSYPFLINLWSAELFTLGANWRGLSVIFAFQWLLVSTLLLSVSRTLKAPWLPWLILFGGGSFFSLGANSGEHISDGAFWTLFLTTLWIPQRTFLPGIVFGFVALSLIYRATTADSQREESNAAWPQMFWGAVILGLLPLVHLQCALIFTVIAILLVLNSYNSRDVVAFGAGLFLLLFSLPWVLAKASVVSFAPFWLFSGLIPKDAAMSDSLLNSALLWGQHGWPLLLMLGWLLLQKTTWRYALVLICLFVTGNLLQLSFWNWDQLKFFVCIYMGCLFLLTLTCAYRRFIVLILGVTLIPTAYECFQLIVAGPRYEVFSGQALRQAVNIRENTPARAIILAEPLHNSPVVLSGRRLFLGYDGTLWSHGIPYYERKRRSEDSGFITNCDEPPCPSYILKPAKLRGGRELLRDSSLTRVAPDLYKIHP